MMTVSEVISALNKCDPDKEVVIRLWDDPMYSRGILAVYPEEKPRPRAQHTFCVIVADTRTHD